MNGRTGRQVVADEEQLAHEKRIIAHAREALADYDADPRRAELAICAVHIGRLHFYVRELATALEHRQRSAGS